MLWQCWIPSKWFFTLSWFHSVLCTLDVIPNLHQLVQASRSIHPRDPLITPGPIPVQVNQNCQTSCVVNRPAVVVYEWSSYSVSTHITVGTLFYIVDEDSKTTSTSLKYDPLPPGYSLPERNSQGQLISTITIDNQMFGITTTVLTYPTPFTDYNLGYHWSGVLNFPGTSNFPDVCSTNNDFHFFQSHPPLSLFHSIKTVYNYPQDFPDADFIGQNYAINLRYVQDYSMNFFTNAFPNELPLLHCDFQDIEPMGVLISASFLTQTRTIYRPPRHRLIRRNPPFLDSLVSNLQPTISSPSLISQFCPISLHPTPSLNHLPDHSITSHMPSNFPLTTIASISATPSITIHSI